MNNSKPTYSMIVTSRSLLDSQSPVTYTYDVHGWLTGIAGGEFAQTLRYDRRADGSAGYLNGNIASSTVTIRATTDIPTYY